MGSLLRARRARAVATDCVQESLESLSEHIIGTHHAYVKRELPRLALLAQKVVNRHGATTAELPVVQATLAKLDEELTQHLAKEEAILFPYVVLLERASANGSPKPRGGFQIGRAH